MSSSQTRHAHGLSSGDLDDWEQLEVPPGQASVQNFLFLEEEEEEDGEEVEQGQDVRKVTVRCYKHSYMHFSHK